MVTHRVPTDWADAHPDAPFSFVTDGVAAAITRAQELVGDRVVAVAGGTIARQCLELGLLDEVAVDLVPVVMGEGNRPFFGELSSEDVMLGSPTTCVQASGKTRPMKIPADVLYKGHLTDHTAKITATEPEPVAGGRPSSGYLLDWRLCSAGCDRRLGT